MHLPLRRRHLRAARTRLALLVTVLALALAPVVSASASPASQPGPGLDVAAENQHPGTPTWALRNVQVDGRTWAFTDHTSVLPGTPVGLSVECAATTFTVRALRIGFYGGHLARTVWTSAPTPCPKQQPAAIVDHRTWMIRTPWPRTLTIDTTGWPEGMYVLEVVANTSSATYADLILRSATTQGRVVFVSSTLTSLAYNEWGGRNTYRGKRGFRDRARVVSFDRPNSWGQGAGKFLQYEAPLLSRAEHLGLPLAYLADTDISDNPHVLDGATSIIFGGHSEYWTQAERDAVIAARKAGTNLLFFGANTAYWRVRLSASPLGPDRIMSIYKIQAEDPNRAHPSIRFRDLGYPDAQVTGLTYNCFPARGTFIVTDPASWVFAGTGVRTGSRFAGLIGPEVDQLRGNPAGATVLASSPARCGVRIKTHSTMAMFRDPSGAATVAVGTMGWVSEALRGRVPAATARFVRITTDNLLRASVRRGLG